MSHGNQNSGHQGSYAVTHGTHGGYAENQGGYAANHGGYARDDYYDYE